MPIKIIVIGGGPGGYVAALRAASLGGSVTLIEKGNLGGTCLNKGCIPSKIMKNSADVFLKFLKAENLGINVQGSVTPDILKLMERKNKILDTQRKGIESLLKKAGVIIEKGRAKIKTPTAESKGVVEVDLNDGSKKELEYDKLIIATGTKPLNVKDFPFDHDNILSSDDLLEMEQIPSSILIVGGGVIGCEFAFIFSALGSRVTIVEGMSRLLPLPSVDGEISKLLLREMKKRKIKVFCDTIVKSTSIKQDEISIDLDASPFTDNPKPKALKIESVKAQKMAVCIGRKPLSSDLGLENINVEIDSSGWIQTNEKLETNVKNVYAIGDILGPDKVMLAHVASHEALIAAQNAMGAKDIMNYDVIPGAIFTMPEIATVGLSESQAEENGCNIETFTMKFRTLGKAHAIDEITG
ncbi:MAG: NAD(P)/FAD-dependent oxidoreductase, partial [Desulfobacula sp.]|nr:NAD(P)/FAD-dependent oxidoreductase [Desulfobacula sp.]